LCSAPGPLIISAAGSAGQGRPGRRPAWLGSTDD
jgi:hypothetical protein